MESQPSPLTTNPKIDKLDAGQALKPKTVEHPLVRRVTFGDLADRWVLHVVIEMIKSAGPPNALRDDEWALKLSDGSLEAFWVMTEEGDQTGLLSFEVGIDEGKRILYVVSAAIPENALSGGAWAILFEYGEMLAAARQCQQIQFDAAPGNSRMIRIGRLLEFAESRGAVRGIPDTVRFTKEVRHGQNT